MFAGGIDTQHFGAVHGLDVAFDWKTQEVAPHVRDWILRGGFPLTGLRSRIGSALFGGLLHYTARFAGGSIGTLSYGVGQRWWGSGPKVSPLHILWGCTPDSEGISEIDVFIIADREPGFLNGLRAAARKLLTLILLWFLRDDDIPAYPNMRFQLSHPVKEDACMLRYVRFVNQLPLSPWTPSDD